MSEFHGDTLAVREEGDTPYPARAVGWYATIVLSLLGWLAILDRFIENPDAVAPGNSMKPYTGISDPEARAKIVAYLKEQGG